MTETKGRDKLTPVGNVPVGKRLILLAFYIPLSLAVAVLSFGFGHGSFIPLALFYSWMSVVVGLIMEFNYFPGVEWVLLILLVIYQVIYFVITTVAARRGVRYYAACIVIHLIGTTATLCFGVKNDSFPASLYLATMIIALVLFCGYHYVDWKLMKGESLMV